MPHDIIDNRSEKLLDHIKLILPGSERARFAVGYLFLSGLKPIHRHLEQLLGSLKTRTLVTTCSGCHSNLQDKLKEKGDYQVKMLPEVVLEAVRGQ